MWTEWTRKGLFLWPLAKVCGARGKGGDNFTLVNTVALDVHPFAFDCVSILRFYHSVNPWERPYEQPVFKIQQTRY
jgi:hypothetical protein